MQNTVHFILQGKGGIGKTLVSTILAQWLAAKDETPLRCYDTDQENATFSRYKAMDVKHVPVMTDARTIDPKRFDALMIDILEEDGNCVIDNGANTFSPLVAYLIENDCFALLQESGRKLAYKATGGILFEVTRDSERRGVRQKKTNFDDVLVENSEIHHVDGIGLSNRSAWMCRPRGAPCGDFPPYKNNPGYLQETAAQAATEFHPSTRLVFRNNKIHDIGGDGIVVRTATAPLVEANLLYDIWMRAPGNSAGAWAINTDGAVFQYNEVHGVRLRPEIEGVDGMAFDADMGTRGTRIYANYSHGNAGGLMLFCACGKDGLGQQAMVEDVMVERNLSLNDKRRAILVAGLDNAVVSGNLIVTSGATPLLESHDKGTSDVLELRGNRFVDTSGGGALYRPFKKSGSNARYTWRCCFSATSAGRCRAPTSMKP
eukprot:gene42336-52499_t